jgi:hypothetical protein|tara:strand:- start:461 stop:664 length:204 start_codon:yes stop_codon:yes gene_type:complete
MCGSSFKGYLEVSLGMETINEFGAVNLKYGPLYDNEDLLLEIGNGVLVMKFNVSMVKTLARAMYLHK